MQQLYSTKFVRYNVLVDDDKYYLIDLFSNKLTLLLPLTAIIMKRTGFVTEKDIVQESIIKKQIKKKDASFAIIMGLVFVLTRVAIILRDYSEINIDPKTVILIEIFIIIASLFLFFVKMIFDKKNMLDIMSIRNCDVVVIRRKFDKEIPKKRIPVYLFMSVFIWGSLYFYIYINMLHSSIFFFVFIFVYYNLILFIMCLTLGETKENDFSIKPLNNS